MYERSYGAKYEHGKWQSAADIAKLMRADIKAAIGAGELPGTAKNYSVRVHNYSGGRSIDILAIDLPGMWMDCDGTVSDKPYARDCRRYEHDQDKTHRTLTDEARRIKKILKAIHNAYNHDGSEVMTDYFDVNFYGSADIEDEWHAEYRAKEKARKATKA